MRVKRRLEKKHRRRLCTLCRYYCLSASRARARTYLIVWSGICGMSLSSVDVWVAYSQPVEAFSMHGAMRLKAFGFKSLPEALCLSGELS